MNYKMIQFIQSIHSDNLDSFFRMVTFLGEPYFALACIGMIYWCINKKSGLFIALCYSINTFMNPVLKDIFAVKRPELMYEDIRVLDKSDDYSFPSAHIQGASSVLLSLAVCFKNKIVTIISIILVLFVGISRIYLGAHYLTDIIGGIAVAIGVIKLLYYFYYSKTNINAGKILIIISLLLCILSLILFRTFLCYAGWGFLIGMFMGYMIEEKYVHYCIPTNYFVKAIILIIGLLGMLGVSFLWLYTLGDNLFSILGLYFLLGLYIFAGFPIVIVRLKLCKNVRGGEGIGK